MMLFINFLIFMVVMSFIVMGMVIIKALLMGDEPWEEPEEPEPEPPSPPSKPEPPKTKTW